MCGIWASINAPDAVAGLRAAAHRGPDGEGWARFDTPAGRLELGHRRLAIYDPSDKSAQPMQTAEGRYTLIFNGALYNYRELRDALKTKGHVFRTTGDTEVFLAAFAEWGTDCFAKIDGMFAAVFYDTQRQVLTIARDRFGEKPLFVAGYNGKSLAFASEASQLMAGMKVSARIDPFTLNAFIGSAQVDNRYNFTSWNDVSRCPAGLWYEVELKNGAVPDHKVVSGHKGKMFWKQDVEWTMSEDDAVSKLRKAMDEAVSRQLVADVPVGTCLSGGLDSSIILGSVNRLRDANSDPFICISAIFDETDDAGHSLSERPYVEAAISGKNVELIEVSPTENDVVDRLDEIILAQGEPFPGTSICAQYFVFEAARKAGIKVMLDGQGADELFAGYAPMAGYALADRLAKLDPSFLKEFNALVAEPSDLTVVSLGRNIWRALVSEHFRRIVLGAMGRWPPSGAVAAPKFPDPFKQEAGLSRFDTFIRILVRGAHLPGLLRYEDRNAMAFAVETRLPFLSQAIGDLAFRVPGELKVKKGYTKYILRKAFEDRLPPEIAWRRKKFGFVTPQQKWMRGKVGIWVDRHIESAIETFRPMLNDDWIAHERVRRAVGAVPGETAFRVACAGRWAELTGAVLD
jgi:asparagine synthase (glutamine-hydrolysing)